jgi:hypothetical protein
VKVLTLFFSLILCGTCAIAQEDSTVVKKQKQTKSVPSPAVYIPKDSAAIADSIRREKTRRVTRHSAIIPGWGQVNNKQAWKLPFVYGALGFTTYLFFDNLSIYKDLREAYIVRTDTIPTNDNDMPIEYQPLSTNSIRFYRDEYRKNVDYSALAFIILWGLNVVDATVFANLREFDVSDEIGLKLKAPDFNLATGHTQIGIALQLKPASKTLKPLPSR